MDALRLLVLLWTATGVCSGFVISDGYILTAAHCPKDPMANGVQATLVKEDSEKDIMLLKADVKGKAQFADAKVGEEVVVAGYFNRTHIVTRGRVAHVSEYLILDITTLKGESGAAVYNRHGKIVGMVVGGMTDSHQTLTVAVPTKQLLKFLEVK